MCRFTWWAAIVSLLIVWPAMSAMAGEANPKIGRTTLKLTRVYCASCLRVIDAELRKVPGVLGLSADMADNRVTVDHELTITPVQVAQAVTDSGYPARVVEVETLPRREARLFQRDLGFGSGPGYCNLGGINPVADSWRELRRRFMGMRRGNRTR